MHSRWQRYGLVLLVAILSVASVAALVHRHVGLIDEVGCVVCHVRHEPGIQTPVATAIEAPVSIERSLDIPEFLCESRDSVPVRSGRAPPQSS